MGPEAVREHEPHLECEGTASREDMRGWQGPVCRAGGLVPPHLGQGPREVVNGEVVGDRISQAVSTSGSETASPHPTPWKALGGGCEADPHLSHPRPLPDQYGVKLRLLAHDSLTVFHAPMASAMLVVLGAWGPMEKSWGECGAGGVEGRGWLSVCPTKVVLPLCIRSSVLPHCFLDPRDTPGQCPGSHGEPCVQSESHVDILSWPTGS